jgi:flagellar assembly factor FliW
MKIETKYFGQVEVAKEQIITFPQGILGFELHREFVILNILDNPNFKILQDLKHPNIAFFIINPWSFFQDYVADIADEDLAKIGIEADGEPNLFLFNIVTLGKTFKESTVNLLAPIVINMDKMQGKQYILNDSPYTTRQRLFTQGEGE